MKYGRAFQGFQEAKIEFAPSYKFTPGDIRNFYFLGTEKRKRIPSYTDRILYYTNNTETGLKSSCYESIMDIFISDHKPIIGIYQIEVLNFFLSNLLLLHRLKRLIEKDLM